MLRNSTRGYGLVAIVLHWLIGLLFIGQIGLGLIMVRLDDQRRAFDLIQLHKSFGFLLLALVLARIAWRTVNTQPDPPEGGATWESRAALAAHRWLYVLMLLLPLTGWVLVSVSTLAMPTYAFYRVVIPNLPLPISDAAENFWSRVHQWLGYAAAALVLLHILAALRHQFWLGDRTLRRMLRPTRE